GGKSHGFTVSRNGAIIESAVIIDIGEKSFDVLIQRFGLEKRFALDDLTKPSNGSAPATTAVIEVAATDKTTDTKTNRPNPRGRLLRVQWSNATASQCLAVLDVIAVEISTRTV